MEFGEYCQNLIGEYNWNLKRLSTESTDMVFGYVKNPNLEIRKIKNKQMNKGKFYLVRYNYNGNKLWCPIFVIDDRYSPELQKRIIYAINLDYLPYKYKIVFFDKLFRMFKDVIEKNRKINGNGGNANEEIPLKIDFESMYRALKNSGDFSYCITAFDFSKFVGTGDPEVYSVSLSILNRFIFLNTKPVNGKIIMETLKEVEVEDQKNKLKILLEAYQKTIDNFDNDVKEYYKSLKALESKYKLFENV